MTSISTSPAGLRINEPAADLAAAAALVSSLANAPLPADAVYFGEVSLSGAVRPVAQTAARLKEAQKLGFARAVMPDSRGRLGSGARVSNTVSSLVGLVSEIAAKGEKRGKSGPGPRPRRRMTRVPPGRYTHARMPVSSSLETQPKNDTKLNHWAEYPRPLPVPVRARECGMKPVPIRPIQAAIRRPAIRPS